MDTVEIPLPSGHIALIDAADRALVEPYNWFASVGKWGVYVVRNRLKSDPPRMHRKLHRLLLNAAPGQLVDHRNHDGLDNRRGNLRLCTNADNQGNSRRGRNSTSGYKGVTWHKQRGRWYAHISIDGRFRSLGLYDDPWDAAQAYNTAAIEAFGEFAHLNTRIVAELLGGASVTRIDQRKAS